MHIKHFDKIFSCINLIVKEISFKKFIKFYFRAIATEAADRHARTKKERMEKVERVNYGMKSPTLFAQFLAMATIAIVMFILNTSAAFAFNILCASQRNSMTASSSTLKSKMLLELCV